jgi:hypothetical protein
MYVCIQISLHVYIYYKLKNEILFLIAICFHWLHTTSMYVPHDVAEAWRHKEHNQINGIGSCCFTGQSDAQNAYKDRNARHERFPKVPKIQLCSYYYIFKLSPCTLAGFDLTTQASGGDTTM